jgi:hypothetical protein
MDGILEFMEDNMKNIKCIFALVIILISPVSSSDGLIKNEFARKKDISVDILERQTNPKILIDSVVIKNKSNLFKSVPGATRIGDFVYGKNPDKLKEFLLDNQAQSTKSSVFESSFRLVEIPGKNNLITDGSFIVFFKNSLDKEQFNLDYNLVPRYEMPAAISYKSDNFETLQAFINTLEDDERVESIELDLIDPYIQVQ